MEDPHDPLLASPHHHSEHSEPTASITDETTDIIQPLETDILSGRGAKINSQKGNQRFRALCFAQKEFFEAGSIAAKRRIATEIVLAMKEQHQARFLKRKADNAPWYEMSMEQCIQKACQVLRDHKRPDRERIRKRERRVESTPPIEPTPLFLPRDNLFENPFGVHSHDVLCGRGAYVNGHVGNQRLRKLAMERKIAFDAGNFTEKQALATEIVGIIKSLDPPGRFLKRIPTNNSNHSDPKSPTYEWEELCEQKAIHKSCQVMRDIDRPDRAERASKRRRGRKEEESDTAEEPGSLNEISAAAQMIAEETASETILQANDDDDVVSLNDPHKLDHIDDHHSDTVHETVVAAAEAALDHALDTSPFV